MERFVWCEASLKVWPILQAIHDSTVVASLFNPKFGVKLDVYLSGADPKSHH